MQVAKQQVVLAQARQVTGNRLLDLDDHLGDFVELVGVGNHLDAIADEILVAEAALQSGTRLDEHLVATQDQIRTGGWNEGNTPFKGLGLGRNTDAHQDLQIGQGMQRRVAGAVFTELSTPAFRLRLDSSSPAPHPHQPNAWRPEHGSPANTE